ncbi:hypothetical protein AMECASPLE_014733 [Ameca splendens]|uniref:Uncharacterized protein n=1 Tax=Ameca splendens TaxID=208324 RepID=A0ABV0ZCF6_9TELE
MWLCKNSYAKCNPNQKKHHGWSRQNICNSSNQTRSAPQSHIFTPNKATFAPTITLLSKLLLQETQDACTSRLPLISFCLSQFLQRLTYHLSNYHKSRSIPVENLHSPVERLELDQTCLKPSLICSGLCFF